MGEEQNLAEKHWTSILNSEMNLSFGKMKKVLYFWKTYNNPTKEPEIIVPILIFTLLFCFLDFKLALNLHSKEHPRLFTFILLHLLIVFTTKGFFKANMISCTLSQIYTLTLYSEMIYIPLSILFLFFKPLINYILFFVTIPILVKSAYNLYFLIIPDDLQIKFIILSLVHGLLLFTWYFRIPIY